MSKQWSIPGETDGRCHVLQVADSVELPGGGTRTPKGLRQVDPAS
jgi:hypothetical protein